MRSYSQETSSEFKPMPACLSIILADIDDFRLITTIDQHPGHLSIVYRNFYLFLAHSSNFLLGLRRLTCCRPRILESQHPTSEHPAFSLLFQDSGCLEIP